MTSIAIKT